MIYGKVLESELKSKLDKDHITGKQKSLSSFTRKELTADMIRQYKEKYKLMKHIDPRDEIKYAWFDGDNLVAYLILNHNDGKILWITALEVTPEYRGYQLGNQLIDFATLQGAQALAVAKDNEIAIKMYESKGFKISEESKKDVKSGKKNNYLMYK